MRKCRPESPIRRPRWAPEWLVVLAIGVLAAVAAMALRLWVFGPWFDTWERTNYDDLIRQHAVVHPCVKDARTRVMVIAIDHASEEALGPFPWPRSTHARLVGELKRLGFSVIGFDVIFDRPSTGARGANSDMALAAAASAAGNVVWSSLYPDRPDLEGPDLKGPIPLLSGARGSVTGFANVDEDVDRTARSIPALYRDAKGVTAPFAILVSQRYQGRSTDVKVVGRTLYGDGLRIPLDARGHFPIRYFGPEYAGAGDQADIAHISASDVLSGEVPDNFFHGKIALVGRWDKLDIDRDPEDAHRKPVMDDLHHTPYTAMANLVDPLHGQPDPLSGNMYGVEIQAQAVLAILDRIFIRPASVALMAAIVLLISVIVAFVVSRLCPWLAILPALATVFVYWTIAQWLFLSHNLWLEFYVVPLAVAVSGVAVVAERMMAESRERARTLDLFRRYVAPKVAARLLKDPRALRLGSGQRVDVSVLFCDVRGFGARAEKLSPEEVLAWLSYHMEMMVDAIHAEDGTVDKYMGDGVMAVFGAPESQPDHAERAIRTARAMCDAVKEWNDERSAQGLWTYDVGIGIHSGPAVAGSLGHHNRLEYAVVGDTVNAAFRVEGLTRKYCCRILISGETLKAAGKQDPPASWVCATNVDGRAQPVEVYLVPAAGAALPGVQPGPGESIGVT